MSALHFHYYKDILYMLILETDTYSSYIYVCVCVCVCVCIQAEFHHENTLCYVDIFLDVQRFHYFWWNILKTKSILLGIIHYQTLISWNSANKNMNIK